MSRRRGFTLIELLIAASILGMVSLAVLSVFGTGLRTFDRVQAFGGSQAGLLLFLEKFETDVRNAFELPGASFSGSARSMSFAGVTSKLDEEDNPFVALGKKSYLFDDAQNVLVSQEEDYPEALSSSSDVRSERVAAVTDVRFQYYAYTKEVEEEQEKIEYGWQDAWSEEDVLPRGVRMEVTFKNGEEDVTWERTVFIPAGGDIPGIEAEEEEEAEGQGDV